MDLTNLIATEDPSVLSYGSIILLVFIILTEAEAWENGTLSALDIYAHIPILPENVTVGTGWRFCWLSSSPASLPNGYCLLQALQSYPRLYGAVYKKKTAIQIN